MSRDTYIIKVCEECANAVLGIVLVRLSHDTEHKKCPFCGKTRYLYTYRATTIPKGDTHG